MLNIIKVPNTSIGKQMYLSPEIYRGKSWCDMVMLTSKEVEYGFEYEKYDGSLSDLPEGTAIQIQAPGQSAMHFVKRGGSWCEITIDQSIESQVIESASHATVTILYKPE